MFVRGRLDKNISISTIAGLIVVSLLFMPLAAANLWWCEVSNSGHTILFLFISIVLYYWLSVVFRFSSIAITYLVVLVTGLLLGIAIEMLQGCCKDRSVLMIYTEIFME